MTSGGEPRARGRFITIEGPDGSGKTTLAAALRDRLAGAGIPVLLTREPGGTALGDRIRDIVLDASSQRHELDPATDALLFSAARARHTREVVEPALDRGEVVISARYVDSTLAYQGYGGGVDLATLRVIGSLATDGLVPDLTILLDLPVEEGLARKSAEITRFEESFDRAYHERVRAGFLAMADAEPERWAVIDGRRSPADVLAAAVEACTRLPDLASVADPRTG